MFDSTEVLVGEIAYAYQSGVESGPARLEFTSLRFRAVASPAPAGQSGLLGFKAWRAAVPPGPVCRLLNVPFVGPPGPVLLECPNSTVYRIRLNPEHGILVDKTSTDLILEHEAAFPTIFRIPALLPEVVNLVRQTPLAPVVYTPGP